MLTDVRFKFDYHMNVFSYFIPKTGLIFHMHQNLNLNYTSLWKQILSLLLSIFHNFIANCEHSENKHHSDIWVICPFL